MPRQLADYRINILWRLTPATLPPRAAAFAAALTPWATAALAALIIPWHDALAPSPFNSALQRFWHRVAEILVHRL